MKSLKLFIPIALILIILIPNTSIGQVLISAGAGSPAATSMLEISSTAKGLLIPRMTTTERDAIAVTPPTSLMVFNITTNAYNYWNGSAWIAMAAGNIKEISDTNNNTKVEVERTPDEDLIHFKVDGAEVAYLNGNSIQFFGQGSSIFIGEDAGLSDDGSSNANTVVGAFSGGSLISGEHNVSIGAFSSENLVSGADNITIGYGAGNSNNASGNTFIGSLAGELNGVGTGNVFVGQEAGKMATASNNTFLGFQAGKATTSGTSNTFIGQGAGLSNATASNNTYVGKDVGDVSTGSDNTFLGHEAGTANTSGSSNTFIGKNAGLLNNTGTDNTCIGHLASVSLSNLTNATAIGAYADVIQSNSLVLGGGADVGIGTSSPDAKLEVAKGVNGNTPVAIIYNQTNNNSDFNNGLTIRAGHNVYNATSQSSLISFQIPNTTVIGNVIQNGATSVAYNTTSDERLKTNIRNTRFGIHDVMKIRVCDYVYNGTTDDDQTGYLAQQLYTIFPTAVHVGSEDLMTDPWMVDYGRITPLLVKGMQDEQVEIETLQNTISDLVSQLEALKEQVEVMVRKSE